ncbi:hypothetical protein ACWC1S_004609 [Vibrio parahaemolyticus]|uniref:hypothetical protein n=1 Tax=Vibrio parahaemolyticus TaxID=670 RepID=UPI0035A60657
MRIKQSDKPQEKESLTQGISSKTHPAYNAALRGECRINQLSADHFTTKTYCIPKMPRGMNPS